MNPRHELGSTEAKTDKSAIAIGLVLMSVGLCRILTANQFLNGIPDQGLVNVVSGVFATGGFVMIGNEVRKAMTR